MRRSAALLIATVAAALAGPAAAQLSKPRRDPFVHVVPPRPAGVTPVPYALPPPAPPRLALTGLPAMGDAAPLCRAQCARSRLVCEAADGDCTPAWLTCLSTCSAGAPARR